MTDSSRRTPRGSGRTGSAFALVKGIRVTGFTVVIFALVVLSVVILAPSLRVLIEQRQQIAALEASVAERTEQNEQLGDDILRWEDPAFIKAEARDRLYYVLPGETSFLIIDDIGAAAGVGPTQVSDSIKNTEVDWLSAILVSGLGAALTPVPSK